MFMALSYWIGVVKGWLLGRLALREVEDWDW